MNNSSPGQAIYEPFSGSGTTLIAAEMTGWSCPAIELDPVYVDVAVLRWQAFTGRPQFLKETIAPSPKLRPSGDRRRAADGTPRIMGKPVAIIPKKCDTVEV